MNMLKKINSRYLRKQWFESIQGSTVKIYVFIFVPDHAGVRGNERADFSAKVADVGEGRSMNSADIVSAIKNAGHVSDFTGESETAALTRMLEIEVKQGVARKDRFVKATKRIVNQH